jgi:hypothetical protein
MIDDLRDGLNDILGVRDDIGAALKEVYLVTRTWSGLSIGAGTATETSVRMLPSPRVVEFTDDLRIREGGVVKQGDLLLKQVSQQTYPTIDLVDGTSEAKNVEKLYDVGGKLFRVVSVTTKHLTWRVLLRPLSSQKRFSDG